MKTILEDKKPIIQAEIGGKENRKNTYDLLIGMGYEMYYLVNHKLTVLSESKFSNLSQDIYFVHKDRKEEISFLRSEEHTSELQSRPHLVCRLLLEKKKKK